MLLYGRPVVDHLKKETQSFIDKSSLRWAYVAFFLLSDDKPSAVYVGLKQKFATSVWLESQIVSGSDLEKDTVLDRIQEYNTDPACIGIVVQLPVADHLYPYQAEILCAVSPEKDLDGLGGKLFGLAIAGRIEFLPATPKAVMQILSYYQIDRLQWKSVTILWQSNLVGKPLAVEMMKRGASVASFNKDSALPDIKYAARHCDYLISATGQSELVDDSFLANDASHQIIIDVGRGIKDGQAVGDTCRKELASKVQAITPVPGWVWPVTVACLFHNLLSLRE